MIPSIKDNFERMISSPYTKSPTAAWSIRARMTTCNAPKTAVL